MKNIPFIILAIFMLSFTMCKQETHIKKEDNVIQVDLDNPEKASLFDYFRSIELIPLETTPDVLVKGFTKMVVHQGNYYALDKPQSIIFAFDPTGKCLFKIDKKGQGTGEYSFISDFIINPYNGYLELLEPYGEIHRFDLSGNYIESKRITYPGFRVAHSLAALDTSVYVFHSYFEPKKITYYNLTEQELLHEEFEEDESIGSFSRVPYPYKDNWFFFRPFHPIVYRLGKEKLEPVFQFDFGKYATEGRTATLSKESQRNFTRQTEEMFDQFSYMIHSVRHNQKYVLASLCWKDYDHKGNIFYNKETGEIKYILNFDENVWFNSYRGEEVIVTDEYVLMPIQWVDLEKRVSKDMLDEKQQAILEELLQADMEQNPVLIKYYFK